MIPVYWINLEESIERRNSMIKQFRDNNIWHRRIEGIKHERGITGCCLSHIKAIHTAWIDGNELAIICEDDADFSKGNIIFSRIQTILDTIPEHIKDDWDILQIQYTEPHFLKGITDYIEIFPNIQNIQNRLIQRHMYGSVAYLINRKGMAKFLNLMTKVDSKDKYKYIVTADFSYPQAHAESLLYDYINSYFSLFPIVNYSKEDSLVNTTNKYHLINEFNRIFTDKILSKLDIHNYKVVQNKTNYLLPNKFQWFVGSDAEVTQNIKNTIDYLMNN